MRSIVRRESGESYEEFLTTLAKASGIGTPTRADLARIDRKRKKKGSNDDWTHPRDPDAKITKMKDGRTHLAHKAEHAIDLVTGAIVGVTVQGADEGDTTTIEATSPEAAEHLEAVAAVTDDPTTVIEEVVADKGYHSRRTVYDRLASATYCLLLEEPIRPLRNVRRGTGQSDDRRRQIQKKNDKIAHDTILTIPPDLGGAPHRRCPGAQRITSATPPPRVSSRVRFRPRRNATPMARPRDMTTAWDMNVTAPIGFALRFSTRLVIAIT